MSERIPCTLCGRMILLTTAQINAGLCGQCVRDPVAARRDQEKKKKIESFGPLSAEAIEYRLSSLTERVVREGVETLIEEGIYGFYLVCDPCFEMVSCLFLTDAIVREGVADRWEWFDSRSHSLAEDEFEALSSFAYPLMRNDDESDFIVPCLKALKNVRDKGIVDNTVFLGVVSGGEGIEETIALVEGINTTESMERFRSGRGPIDDAAVGVFRKTFERERSALQDS